MIFPRVVFLLLFNYIPMTGLQIAFKDFQLGDTIWSSKWVGFENFSFLNDAEFWKVVRNTIIISSLKFAVNFITPVILALMFNEVTSLRYKE